MIAIDSFLNMVPGNSKDWSSNSTELYKAVYFVSPPAFFKEPEPLTEEAHFTREFDLDSPVSAPIYQDGWTPFRHVMFSEKTLLLIEVRCMRKWGKKRSKNTPILEKKRAFGALFSSKIFLNLFLFFGWFREAEIVDCNYRYKSDSTGHHRIFGWMFVNQKIFG